MTTWVFLRGLTREARHWGRFVATFRAEVDAVPVVALDLPGNGSLYRSRSPASVEEMAEYCRAELAARGLRPPYYLLAMSLGAMVAVAWAQRYPDELLGCVLINTSLRRFSPFYRRLQPGSYAPLLARVLGASSARDWEETIMRLTSNGRSDSANILDAWVAYRREHPVSRRNAWRQLFAALRYRVAPDKPAVRLLVLASAQDALVHPSCSRRLTQCWQAAYAEHPRAGHDLPLDDGAWVAGQVRQWLAAEAAAARQT